MNKLYLFLVVERYKEIKIEIEEIKRINKDIESLINEKDMILKKKKLNKNEKNENSFVNFESIQKEINAIQVYFF